MKNLWKLLHKARLGNTKKDDLDTCATAATIRANTIAWIALLVSVLSLFVTAIPILNSLAEIRRAVNYADPWIVAGLRNVGGGDYLNVVEARPGEIVEGQLYVRNTTGHPVEFAVWVNTPSDYLSIVPGSARFWNSGMTGEPLLNAQGAPIDISRPVRLAGYYGQHDLLAQTGWFTITFQMQIDEGAARVAGQRFLIVSTVAAYGDDGRLVANAVDFVTHIDIVTD